MFRQSRNRFSLVSGLFLAAFLAAGSAAAQQPKTLIKDKPKLGFFVAPEAKLSSVDGKFASFAGVRAGVILDHRLFLGVGGYGKTNETFSSTVGYGGVVAEYIVHSQGLINLSVGGLVGGGYADRFWHISSWMEDRTFFVAEPQAHLSVNVSPWFRLGFGGGYRFAGKTPRQTPDLSGPTASIVLSFGKF